MMAMLPTPKEWEDLRKKSLTLMESKFGVVPLSESVMVEEDAFSDKPLHLAFSAFLGHLLSRSFCEVKAADARSSLEEMTLEDNFEIVFEKPVEKVAEENRPVVSFQRIHLMLDLLIQYLCSSSLVHGIKESLGEEILADKTDFLRGLDLKSQRALLGRLLDASLVKGHFWAVALGDFLEGLDSSLVPKVEQMVPNLNEWSESKVQTTVVRILILI